MTKIGFRIGSVMSRKTRNASGAVDRRRLDHLPRDLGQAGEDRDRDEGDRAPDDDRGDDRPALDRVDEPVVVGVGLEAQLRQRPVEDAELEVDHPAPDGHRDDGRHRPHEHEPGRDQQAHERPQALEQERDQRPEEHRQPDGDGGERNRPPEHGPEPAVAEDLPVVVEPDPLALVGDQLGKPVLLERERDEPVERISEHPADHDECGDQQQVGGDVATRLDPPTPSSRHEGRLDGEGNGGVVFHERGFSGRSGSP